MVQGDIVQFLSRKVGRRPVRNCVKIPEKGFNTTGFLTGHHRQIAFLFCIKKQRLVVYLAVVFFIEMFFNLSSSWKNK